MYNEQNKNIHSINRNNNNDKLIIMISIRHSCTKKNILRKLDSRYSGIQVKNDSQM